MHGWHLNLWKTGLDMYGTVCLVRYQSQGVRLQWINFAVNSSDRIRNRLRNKNTNLVIISTSVRNQLQSFGVSINKPLKHLVRKYYDAWLNKNNHTLTPSGKIKRTSVSRIVGGY
jgi:hypothetical protein